MGPGVFQPEAGGQAEKLSGVPGGMATAGTPHVTGRIFDAVEITKKEAIRRGKQVDVQGAEEGMAKVRLGRGVDVDTAEPAASHAELDPEHPAVWGGMENEVPVEGRVEKHHTNTSATVNAKGEVGREVEAGREGLDVASGKKIDLLQEEEVAPAGQGEVEDFVLFLRAAETFNVEGDDTQVHEEGDERARSPTYCIEFSESSEARESSDEGAGRSILASARESLPLEEKEGRAHGGHACVSHRQSGGDPRVPAPEETGEGTGGERGSRDH